MTTSTKPNEQAALFSTAFAHRYLREVLEVVVRVDDEDVSLSDTAVFVFREGMI